MNTSILQIIPFILNLGILVLLIKSIRERKSLITGSFILVVIGILIWILSVAIFPLTRNLDFLYIIAIIAYIGPILVASGMLYFSFLFPKETEPIKNIYKIIILLGTAINLTIINIPKFVLVGIGGEGYSLITGPGLYLLFFIIIIFIFWALKNLVKKYLILYGTHKLQLRYLFLGIAISAILGIIFNALLPVFKIYKFVWMGPLSTVIFVGFTSYAITRYRLMDIRVVVRQTTVWGAAILITLFLGLGVSYFSIRVLNIPAAVSGPLVLLLGIIVFTPLKNYFMKIANQYFFTTLYSYEATMEKLIRELTHEVRFDKVVDSIVNTIMKTMGLDRAGILLVKETKEGRVYQIAKVVGFKEENGISLVKDNFLTQHLEKTQKPLVLEELERLKEETQSKEEKKKIENLKNNMVKIEASLCIPVISRGKLFAIIVLGSKLTKDAYTAQDLRLLEGIAYQSAIALENALLYKNMDEIIKEQTKEIEQLYDMKSQFLRIASHQLRTPVSVIRGLLAEINDPDLPLAQKTKMIRQAIKSSDSLQRIIRDILTATEIDASKMRPYIEPVDITPIIKRVMEDLSPLAKEKNLKFELKTKLKEPFPYVLTDHIKIREAISNIIDNALHYTLKGSVTVIVDKVRLSERGNKEFLMISCKDTGVGMTEEDKQKIGKKFYRNPGLMGIHPNGSGLGIYITRAIVEGSGGKLEFDSEGLNKGSTFTIYLPITKQKPKPVRRVLTG